MNGERNGYRRHGIIGRNTPGVGRRPSPQDLLLERRSPLPFGILGALLAVLLGAGAPAPVAACDITLQTVLGTREKTPFDERALRISRYLEAAVPDMNAHRVSQASQSLTKASDLWMELYMELYVQKPSSVAVPDEEWRALMDSITGAMRRMRVAIDAGHLPATHDLVPPLQGMLAELYGAFPVRNAFLGPVVQTIETLKILPATRKETLAEVSARVLLLRRRFDAWREKVKTSVSGVPAATDFLGYLEAAERALEKKQYAAVDRALAAIPELPIERQAQRASWGLPPIEPPPKDVRFGPEPPPEMGKSWMGNETGATSR